MIYAAPVQPGNFQKTVWQQTNLDIYTGLFAFQEGKDMEVKNPRGAVGLILAQAS